jgi:ABC-2 type transport system permease protein
MSPALAITKRELRAYFNSPVAYIVITAFMLLAGYFFFATLFLEGQAEMRGYFERTPLFFSLIIPAITMRLIAEEKGSGTLELLITMPVRDWEVIVGKFLAAAGLLGVMLLLTVGYAVTLASLGPVDKGPTFGGYFGLILMASSYAAIGVMASSFTRSQIVAFIVAFAISFTLFLFGPIVQLVPPSLQPIVAFLGMSTHFEAIVRGVIDSRDVLYYASVITISLVIATVSLESRRWK